jgi:hypothetical protein
LLVQSWILDGYWTIGTLARKLTIFHFRVALILFSDIVMYNTSAQINS